MNQRITPLFLLLTICFALPSTGFAEAIESSLNASDFEGKSALYFSRPTSIEVVETDEGLFSVDHEGILQIRMELVGFDPVGNRESYIRFSRKMITDYVMVIENFLSIARNAGNSGAGRDGTQLASLLSCDTLKGPVYLKFGYHQPRGSNPYLSIGSTYDPESRSGVHYFTPADAQELVSLLIKFAHAPIEGGQESMELEETTGIGEVPSSTPTTETKESDPILDRFR